LTALLTDCLMALWLTDCYIAHKQTMCSISCGLVVTVIMLLSWVHYQLRPESMWRHEGHMNVPEGVPPYPYRLSYLFTFLSYLISKLVMFSPPLCSYLSIYHTCTLVWYGHRQVLVLYLAPCSSSYFAWALLSLSIVHSLLI